MRELNLDQLRTLVAIADLGTFSAAGRALHLAQPTVSLHVSELESRLATPLLLRGHRRVTPTAAGAVTYLLPQLIAAFEQRHPDIDVQLTLGTSAGLTRRLFVDDFDLALVALPQPGYPALDVTPLRRTPMLAILPGDMKAPAAVTPAWLARHPLILEEPDTHIAQTVTAWFAAAGLRPRPRIEVTINEITRQLVATGYGVSVLPFEHPDETLGGRLQVRPLRPALVRRMGLAHRPLAQLDAPVRRVLDTLMGFRDAK